MTGFSRIKRGLTAGVLVLVVTGVVPSQVRPGRLPRERDRRPLPGIKSPAPRETRRAERAANRRLRLQQDIIRRINLTEEQRLRLREIMRGQEEQLIAAGRRARLARNALDQAMMSPTFDENEINRRAEEFASAQADLIRLQARRRAAVRKIMTPEQVVQFNELEKELRRRQRERLQDDGGPPREP